MAWLLKLLGINPSERKFVEIVKSHLDKSGQGGEYIFDPTEFTLAVKRGSPESDYTYILHNFYRDYCAAALWERERVVQTYLSPRVDIPSAFEDAAKNLLVRLQSRSYYEELQLRAHLVQKGISLESSDIPYVPIATHLGISIIHDSPKMVSYLTTTKSSTWGRSDEELRAIALANLQRLTDKPFSQVQPGVYMSVFGDTHDASRILLRERVAECRVQGRCIAMVASRDHLVITGEDDLHGQSFMLKVAEEASTHARKILTLPLVFTDGKWVELEIKPEHPEADRFAYFRAAAFSDFYNSQKALLDRIHKEQGKDVFVASYIAYEDQRTKKIKTQTVWSEGVPAYLPVAEEVSFVRMINQQVSVLCTVPYDRVLKLLGNLMKPTGMYPERYFVDSFPTADQLSALDKALD